MIKSIMTNYLLKFHWLKSIISINWVANLSAIDIVLYEYYFNELLRCLSSNCIITALRFKLQPFFFSNGFKNAAKLVSCLWGGFLPSFFLFRGSMKIMQVCLIVQNDFFSTSDWNAAWAQRSFVSADENSLNYFGQRKYKNAFHLKKIFG